MYADKYSELSFYWSFAVPPSDSVLASIPFLSRFLAPYVGDVSKNP